ncbi:hypothetical protein CYMTET_31317, partial [Cymbomonas tetramitiformis]
MADNAPAAVPRTEGTPLLDVEAPGIVGDERHSDGSLQSFPQRTSSMETKERIQTLQDRPTFAAPDEEIERILFFQHNYYLVLKVNEYSTVVEIKEQYTNLLNLIKSAFYLYEGSETALAVVSHAYTTLKQPQSR